MPSEDAKPVKVKAEDNHEEEEDKKTKILGSKKVTKPTSANAKSLSKVAKVKKEEPQADDSPTPPSRFKQAKVKKEENDDISDDDDKPLAKRNIKTNLNKIKEARKKKKIKEEVKKKGERAAREKKVYDLPGQKRDPPEEKDPLRIFYETLYNQVPKSEMAQLWMMESGLLPKELAMKVYEKKQKKGLQNKVSSPAKAATGMKSSTRSVAVKKKTASTTVASVSKKTDSTPKQSKKRKAEDDTDSDEDFIIAKAKKRKTA
ncbi:transcriptional regulator ATRX-like protein [Senna tora]|uniref:Transcriptional regulator ATRX-like protein n=1 Tax=Senna tora TaxID=362788 RepID=A0A834U0S4_9FABA|nr:transcriptional regulator ATRX-like protein [Senna tora]